MKYSLYLTCIFFLGCASLTSCDKYLDVQPKDKFLSAEVFQNEKSADAALNGIYLNIAESDLYGEAMTMSDLDIFAQYYNNSTDPSERQNTWNQYMLYEYDQDPVKGSLSSIWQAAYQTILNDNTFIEQISKSPVNFAPDRKNILMGEAYAMRAYLHFDMLRLFGPIYSQDSSEAAIPYLNTPATQIQHILNANIVIDSILKDLSQASILLQNDPIRKEGVAPQTGTDPLSDFYKVRNRRFNYYAVKAIEARVLLYRNDKASALSAAKALIDEAGKWFPWSPGMASLPNIANPDRIFSSEVILGAQNFDMYNQQKALFASSLASYDILMPLKDRLDEVYEKNLNDYRYRVNWVQDIGSQYTDKVFVKYSDVQNNTAAFRNFQPMFRLSELYYIAAECETDPAKQLNYLNVVRTNRGLAELRSGINIDDELTKEYRKEFWGEGQVFFYYKRKNLSKISGGTLDDVDMSAKQYVPPLPLIETQSR